ncbi:MAG TPA: acetyl-CoA carboxylase biotin carboxylase subunit [Elusimicrobiales bacterium]|nr:acetyl-CoA carboxylase biotin carboxylase subunit [Elusimicrobiales bacterium]
MKKEFKKVLVANRGEIAVRVIRTLREMGIKSVAVYSTADKNSLHVQMADESYCIGEGPAKLSYLDMDKILSAAVLSKADAVHPGYGFLSENSEFSKLCSKNDIVFIGPNPDSIRLLGHKSVVRDLAKKSGVPITPGSDGCVKKDYIKIAKKIGFPIMIKAAAGGGGKGMRIVLNEEDLNKEVELAKSEAKAAFGNDDVFFEKYIEKPRHVEIQFARDLKGNVVAFPERDCTLQRRHQKLVEETPSPFVTEEVRKKLQKVVEKLADSANYHGVGTVEFLMDANRDFYFMEVNTRLQVEHPVTESICGVDLVKEQILIAQGREISVSQSYVNNFRGHSIEHRINAEDWENGFRPSVSTIEDVSFPMGPGIRIDTHIYPKYKIPSFYDSMIAKLIVWAPTRNEAIKRSLRALEELDIKGVKTTIGLHKHILSDYNFQKGDVYTKYLEEFIPRVLSEKK